MSERFNVHIRGDGSHLVVLGHGFGENQTIWDAQVSCLLAAGYRVMLFDLAGATDDTLDAFHPARHSRLYGFAEDVLRLMREHQVQGATYVGHSLGGMVGLLAGNGGPGVFSGLVLVAASARYLDDPASGYVGGLNPQELDALIDAMQSDYVAWANGFAARVVADPAQALLTREFTRALLGLRPDIATAVLRAAFLSDHRRDVQQVKVPVRVLQTEFDPAVPLAAAQWLADHAPADPLVVIPTRGHFPHRSAADAVNREILDFLTQHARS